MALTRALVMVLLVARVAAGDDLDTLVGRRVSAVELSGATGAQRLLGQVPIRAGAALSRLSVSQGVRVLYRSGRFARVRAWVEAESDGADSPVRVVFGVEPVRRVVKVVFDRPTVLAERVLVRAAQVPAGTAFSPDVAAAAASRVASALFRAGWRDAKVAWSLKPSAGDDYELHMEPAEGLPTTLVGIEFTGDAGVSQQEAASAFDLGPGDVLEMQHVETGVAVLRDRLRDRAFYRSSVGEPVVLDADQRAVVEVPLKAGPRFRLQIRGNRSFPEAFLLDRIAYGGEEPLGDGLARDLADRLRAFYELAGLPEVKVSVRESAPSPEAASTREAASGSPLDWAPLLEAPRKPIADTEFPDRVVTFLVTEGDRIRVAERTFEGLGAFSTQELITRIDAVLVDAIPPGIAELRAQAFREAARVSGTGVRAEAVREDDPREVFSRQAYRTACSQLTDLYRSKGYLDAVVGPARLERRRDGTGRVVIPVDEGVRTLVSEVRIEGLADLSEEDARKVLTQKDRDPLAFFAVEESRQALASLLQSRGYFFAAVEDEEEIDDQTASAVVTFKVDEGPRVVVAQIEIRGAARTTASLIKDSLALHVGDPVTPAAREQSVGNLLKLGVFTSATVELADPEVTEPQKTLVVQVREKPSVVVEGRAGFSLADGPRASANWANAALLGNNATVSASAKVNYPFTRFLQEYPAGCTTCVFPADPIERRANVGVALPQFRSAGLTPVDLRLDLLHENLLRPAFELSRYAVLGSMDGLFRGRYGPFELSTLLQLEVERARFGRRDTALSGSAALSGTTTVADRQALLLDPGTTVVVSGRPSVTLDARNDRLNPTSGLLLSLAFDFTRSLTAQATTDKGLEPFEVQLLRTLIAANGYIPIWPRRRVVLALGGRLGQIWEAPGTRVIGTKRFFLGGTQTLRGFNEDALQPQDVRTGLTAAYGRCEALLTGAGCPDDARALGTPAPKTSAGGTFMIAARIELRTGLGDTVDGALFVDAGNLWFAQPDDFGLADLRYAVGFGLRYQLPIGPVALDFGVNLSPDPLFNEPTLRPHFAVGVF